MIAAEEAIALRREPAVGELIACRGCGQPFEVERPGQQHCTYDCLLMDVGFL